MKEERACADDPCVEDRRNTSLCVSTYREKAKTRYRKRWERTGWFVDKSSGRAKSVNSIDDAKSRRQRRS